jgi:hypothetical protein
MQARVLKSFDSLSFILGRVDYAKENFPFEGTILDETGRYLFLPNYRIGLDSRAVAGFTANMLYRQGPDGKKAPLGLMSSWQTGGMYPSLDRYARTQDMQVLASPTGASLIALTSPWKGQGWLSISYVPLTGDSPGKLIALLNGGENVAVGTDASTVLVSRTSGRRLPEGGPFKWPAVLGVNDSVLIKDGKIVKQYKGGGAIKHFDVRRGIGVGFAREGILIERLRGNRLEPTVISPPEPRLSSSDESPMVPVSVFLAPSGKKVIVQFRANGAAKKKEDLATWMYDLRTRKWKRVAQGMVVLATSASGKYMLFGGRYLSQPAWLIRVLE